MSTTKALLVAAQNWKKRKASVDMDKIPNCLKEEGYETLEGEEIPSYLVCPICRELLFEPSMFTCGHTICRLCNEGTLHHYRDQCPVCSSTVPAPFPNFILTELLKDKYPQKYEEREKKIFELANIKKKLTLYNKSLRANNLKGKLLRSLTKHWVLHLDQILKNVQKSKAWKPMEVPKDEEVKYCLADLIDEQKFQLIGSHVLQKGSLEAVTKWLEENNTTSNRKWSPFLLASEIQPPWRSGTLHEIHQRLAQLYELDIGPELQPAGWKSAPAYWVLNVKLEEEQEKYEQEYSEFKRALQREYITSTYRNHRIRRSRWDEP